METLGSLCAQTSLLNEPVIRVVHHLSVIARPYFRLM
jgi:hypothetical protein